MATRRHHPLIAAASLVAVAMAWLLLAPTSVGGQAAYVIISGASMEPGMHRGDLAVLRAGTDYAVGDVVTYRHPEIGPVIHRIIGRDGQHFIFQGDNNPFIDPYHPRADELIGRLWLHIPRAGGLLQTLRQPPIFATLAVALLGAALMTPTSSSLRPRRRRGSAPVRAAQWGTLGLLNGALTACMALGLAALALAALSFTRTPTRQVEGELTYSHHGQFDYAAAAPAGLYDGAVARAGDPLFLQVVSSVPVSFTYHLDADAPATLAGVAQLDAVLGDGAGWRRTFPLSGPVAFTARSVTVSGNLDLLALREAITTYETMSGIPRGQYLLDLRPSVSIQGSLAGHPLATVFSPQLRFTLDDRALRPTDQGDEPALVAEEGGSLRFQREEPATLALGPLRLEVTMARRFALIGLEITLVAGLLTGWQIRRAVGHDQGVAAKLRYGHLIISVEEGGSWTAGATRLTCLDELARLAERIGQPILLVECGAAEGYYVRDGAIVYHVRPTAAPQAYHEAV